MTWVVIRRGFAFVLVTPGDWTVIRQLQQGAPALSNQESHHTFLARDGHVYEAYRIPYAHDRWHKCGWFGRQMARVCAILAA